jgi:CheY-like chemotaxis protein
MATFSKRVQPKHRADPADRKRDSAMAPRFGTHAAPVAPEVAPVTPARSAARPDAPAGGQADPSFLRVLIVDDNEDVRGLLRIAFARADIGVVGAAGDSREALALAQHEQPDLVLLDVNLPGIAGLDILPLLREHCPRTRVVMFSAQCNPAVTEAAMDRGAMGFVEKGVSMKSVIAHLRDVAKAPEGQAVQPFPLRA